MIRLYEDIVVGGGVSPDHFFYNMDFAECAAFMRGLQRKDRNEWERARCIMWAALAPHCKGVKNFTDVMRFPWDDEEKKTEVDVKELDRIRNIAKKLEK